MSLKSRSTTWYLGIAVAVLVMWFLDVSGGTILTLSAIGFMVAMHAGGHGGGSHDEHADHDDADLPAGQAGDSLAPSSTRAAMANAEARVRHQRRGGCH